MKGLRQTVVSFFRSETGATAIEYALVASLISIAIIVGATAIGTNLQSSFQDVSAGLS